MKTTIVLSRPARAKLERTKVDTGLKFSTIIDRLILGLPVGQTTADSCKD